MNNDDFGNRLKKAGGNYVRGIPRAILRLVLGLLLIFGVLYIITSCGG